MGENEYLASTSREVQGSLARLLYERNGPEVLPLIATLFAEFGAVEGKKARKKLGELGFVAALKAFFRPAIDAKRAEIIELSEDKLVLKGLTCAMGLRGAGREVCQAIMALDKAIVSNLTGKEVKMDIKQTLADGDSYCLVEFIVAENSQKKRKEGD